MKEALPLMFKAVVFDFDGTLVDTLDLHFQAYSQVFHEIGWELPREVFYQVIGGKADVTIPQMARRVLSVAEIADIHRRKKERVEELFAHAHVPILRAAFLLPLLAGRIPMALASSGSRPGIELLLRRLGWEQFFSVVLTGENVRQGKPHPEVYLTAANKLAVPPEMCLTFEDAEAGLTSARVAGMTVIDVRQPFNLPITMAHSHG